MEIIVKRKILTEEFQCILPGVIFEQEGVQYLKINERSAQMASKGDTSEWNAIRLKDGQMVSFNQCSQVLQSKSVTIEY